MRGTALRVAVMFALAVMTWGVPSGRCQTIDPAELIRTIETQYQGKTSHSIMSMRVVTESYNREMSIESWSKGRDIFLAVIRAPKKDAGTGTLKVDDEIWNYLPKIDRLMRIPSSLMGDSWMGSHITNDDLVKENKIDELYTFETGEAVGDTLTIICHPNPDAAVVWDRIDYRVELTRTVPVDIRYFDEDGVLVRTMAFGDVREIDGRWIPLRMVVLPMEKPDEMTEIVYSDISFDIPLDDNFFSLATLRRQ